MDVRTIPIKRTNVRGGGTPVAREARCPQPAIWVRKLRDLREQHNLSQADVAKILHCSQAAYGMYELGRRRLSVERLVQLAQFYHVTLDALTGLTQEYSKQDEPVEGKHEE